MSVTDLETDGAPPVDDDAVLSGDVHEALTLDRIVHEPARLAILAVLSSAAEVDFAFLQATTGLTKGNLSRQASRLEQSGYISIRKYFKGKIPATGYRITTQGKDAFAAYWARISAIGQSVGQSTPVERMD